MLYLRSLFLLSRSSILNPRSSILDPRFLIVDLQPRSQGFSLEAGWGAPPSFKGKALGTRLLDLRSPIPDPRSPIPDPRSRSRSFIFRERIAWDNIECRTGSRVPRRRSYGFVTQSFPPDEPLRVGGYTGSCRVRQMVVKICFIKILLW